MRLAAMSLLAAALCAPAADAMAQSQGKPPKPIERPVPEYPAADKAAGRGGRVVLQFVVRKDGTPAEIAVVRSSGHPSLDNAATDAVARWRFEPATDADGAPVDQRVQVPFDFGDGSGDMQKVIKDVLKQPCSAVTAEAAAFRAAEPGKNVTEMRTFTLTRGILFAFAANRSAEAMVASVKRMPKVFEIVLSECEKRPEAIYEDVLADALKAAGR